MEKIKFLSDSCCDISRAEAEEFGIEILPILILNGENIYEDWYDFTPQEFYDSLKVWDDLPTTSQVSVEVFLRAFNRAYEEGYDVVIATLLNARASGTYQSANIARGLFFEEERERAFRIDVIDSAIYSFLYGGPLIEGVELARAGASADEVVAHIVHRTQKVCAYAVVYTLDYLQRTGRINRVEGFVGKLLGIKPIIKLADGEINAVEKIRGKKHSVTKLLEMAKRDSDPADNTLYIVYADMEGEVEELEAQVREYFPDHVIKRARLGSVISVHAGPNLLGLGFYRK